LTDISDGRLNQHQMLRQIIAYDSQLCWSHKALDQLHTHSKVTGQTHHGLYIAVQLVMCHFLSMRSVSIFITLLSKQWIPFLCFYFQIIIMWKVKHSVHDHMTSASSCHKDCWNTIHYYIISLTQTADTKLTEWTELT